ncbi:MAG TPA: hypothetical protein VF057_13560 [Thermoanaerobaculia bacterium]
MTLVAALAIGGSAAGAEQDDKDVKVTGCVLKGENGRGFLLADLMLPGASATVPQPRVLYLLKDDDDLEGHTGRRVEIEGELEGELQKAQIEVERDGDAVKLEIKADDRTLKLRLPERPAAVGTSGDDKDDEEIEFVVRKLDVKSMKMVSSTCR